MRSSRRVNCARASRRIRLRRNKARRCRCRAPARCRGGFPFLRLQSRVTQCRARGNGVTEIKSSYSSLSASVSQSRRLTLFASPPRLERKWLASNRVMGWMPCGRCACLRYRGRVVSDGADQAEARHDRLLAHAWRWSGLPTLARRPSMSRVRGARRAAFSAGQKIRARAGRIPRAAVPG